MANIGTYGSNIQAFTPVNILPEPNTPVSWDLLQTVGQFSQRFLPMATVIATLSNPGTYIFNYSLLGCDYFPPYLQFYVYEDGFWIDFNRILGGETGKRAYFSNVGLGTAKLNNESSVVYPFLMVAYK